MWLGCLPHLQKHTEGLKEAESPQRSEGSREVVEQVRMCKHCSCMVVAW